MSGETDRHVPRISRRRALGSLSAVAAAGLAACAAPRPTGGAGSGATPGRHRDGRERRGTSGGDRSGRAATPVTWKHAVASYKFDTAFQLMGQEKGYFRELGIELEPVAVNSGDNMLRGVIVGEFDSGDFGPSIAFPGIAMGGGVKLIGTNNPRVPHVLYGKREINDLRDLYGRMVGTAAPGAFLHALINATMVKEGSSPTVSSGSMSAAVRTSSAPSSAARSMLACRRSSTSRRSRRAPTLRSCWRSGRGCPTT